MEDYICPISFVNENQKRSTDLNELFIAGYRDKICSDYTTSKMIDFIKNSYDYGNLNNDQIGWLNDVSMVEYKAFKDSIISYLVCNITDLTINTLILALQSLNMPNELIDNNLDFIINTLKVRDIVLTTVAGNFMNDAEYLVSDKRLNTIEQIYILINMKMNTVFSVIVARVFDNFVEKFLATCATSGGMSVIFETLYMLVYKDKDWDPNTSYSNMYSFCAAIMREAIDNYTMNYRKGLMDIALTTASMICNNPKYGLNTDNPNYITSTEEYENTGLFGDEFKECVAMLEESEKDKNNDK